MKLCLTLLPLALLGCGSDDAVTLDSGQDEPSDLPASVDFEAGKINRLVSETVNGNIDLQPGGEDGGIRVDVVRQDQEESWDYFLQDQVLAMWPLCSNGVIGCSSGFAIGAPDTTTADLKTVSGEVKISDYNGDVDIENTQGTITGIRLKGGTIVAFGNNVTMNLAFLNEPTALDLTSIDGTINVEVPRGTYALDIQTNGVKSIDELVNGDGPVIKIISTSGDITVIGI